MPRSKPAYPPESPEFKAEAVRLVGSSDRFLSRLAKDLGVADQTLRNWVRHAEIDDGVRDALAPNEREELRRSSAASYQRRAKAWKRARRIVPTIHPARAGSGRPAGTTGRKGAQGGRTRALVAATTECTHV